jgi:hypothetical protein
MILQKTLFKSDSNPKDIIYTSPIIAKIIIDFLQPSGKCLDPCKGTGAFYNLLPHNSDFCEIAEGLDFFDYKNKVEWIISNPPYSILHSFLEKSFELAENVSFLLPVNKIFQNTKIARLINNYGNIYSILSFGGGYSIGFPFNYSVANFHFKKNYSGQTNIKLGII